MKEEDRVTIKLTAKELLLHLADAHVFMYQFFDRHNLYQKNINDYWRWREIDHIKFSRTIYKLKTQKLIKIYKKDKDKYFELTPKGIDKTIKYIADDFKVVSPKKWDKKWRIVIFDIPDEKKLARNILRENLKRLGFILLQESVFIFPFECKREIDFIVNNFFIKPYVKYIVADILEGDDELIEKFLDLEILTPKIISE